MRLLLDVNISPVWVEYLRAAGHDTTHWTSVGDARSTDDRIAGYAAQNGHVIITRDLDFGALLAASHAVQPSVVLLRGPGQLPPAAGIRLLRVLEQTADDLAAGAVVTMDVNKTRVRILPIGRK